MKKKLLFVVLLLFIISLFIGYSQVPKKKIIKPGVNIHKASCRVIGIRPVVTTPAKVVFQVEYFIPISYRGPYYIGANIPNRTAHSTQIAYTPAGRRPNGVPKGRKSYRDNIRVEVQYIGVDPMTTNTMEVFIYNSSGNSVCSKVFNWSKTWKRFKIDGIKRIYTSQERVRLQVQYYIDPTYTNPCFIGAYIPNKVSASSKFSFLPAGGTSGVPKGQRHFSNEVIVDIQYTGSTAYTSRTIEMVIYQRGRNLETSIINWGQRWSNEVY